MAKTVTAPMVGKVFEICCKPGDRIAENQVVAVIEAMKMEVPVIAAASGTVQEIRVAVGDVVESTTVMMTLE